MDPGRYCSLREGVEDGTHLLGYCVTQENEGSKRASMTWRATGMADIAHHAFTQETRIKFLCPTVHVAQVRGNRGHQEPREEQVNGDPVQAELCHRRKGIGNWLRLAGGPGRSRSSHHRMPLHSRNTGLQLNSSPKKHRPRRLVNPKKRGLKKRWMTRWAIFVCPYLAHVVSHREHLDEDPEEIDGSIAVPRCE